MHPLKAPFPYFGSKRRVAQLIWEAFGEPANYVEPFAGSLGVLLGRPTPARVETVNDLDSFISNFWRALAADPEAIARLVDWPVNEVDVHARQAWLVAQRPRLNALLLSDPFAFDAQVAGWWLWGLDAWIGAGWCASSDGVTPRSRHQLPDLSGEAGATGRGVHASGRSTDDVLRWMKQLADRLRRVRVCCGDWRRVLTPAVTTAIGITAVFLDPPYSGDRAANLYSSDSLTVAHEVRAWAIEHGADPMLRIALCGYEGEHAMPQTWRCAAWHASGGYGGQGHGRGRQNAGRERIWFSPSCQQPSQQELFALAV